MSYNILSGNVSTPSDTRVELTGNFSGSFEGDGASLVNVSHVEQTYNDQYRIPYFNNAVSDGSGDRNLRGDETFTFENSSKTVTITTGSFHSIVATGLQAGEATTSSFLALDSSYNVVLTSSSGGGGGTIGAAEDGDYTDGLFTDFISSTPIGTPIDRFNEVLKIWRENQSTPKDAKQEIGMQNSHLKSHEKNSLSQSSSH